MHAHEDYNVLLTFFFLLVLGHNLSNNPPLEHAPIHDAPLRPTHTCPAALFMTFFSRHPALYELDTFGIYALLGDERAVGLKNTTALGPRAND